VLARVRCSVERPAAALAIDDERAFQIPQRRRDNSRIAGGPVMTVAGEQSHALAFALYDQPVAVVLDLVHSGRSGTLALGVSDLKEFMVAALTNDTVWIKTMVK
jgi:hypothetical protein